MKANELRIGNYYSIAENDGIKYKKIMYLIPSAEEWFSDGDNLTLAAKPIPLIEEWLLKFGFPEKDSTMDLLRDFAVCLERRGNRLFVMTIEDGCSHIAKQIKYVHQLQNLYFALIGEELELKH